MKPRYTVYCHTHIESGRRYIGVTKHTMMHRWNQHCAQAMRSKGGRWHFPNAIRKYGKDAFEHYVIEVWDTLEKANEREKYWIKKYDTRNPKFGFNLAEGGGVKSHLIRKNPWDDPIYRAKMAPMCIANMKACHTPESFTKMKATISTPEFKARQSQISKEILSRPGMKAKISIKLTGRTLGVEHRANMSVASTGHVTSPETREKLRVANLGNKHTLGRKWSIETKTKIRNSLKKIGHEISQKNRRFVMKDGHVTHKICRFHGEILISDCWVGKLKNGQLKIECRQCISARARARKGHK